MDDPFIVLSDLDSESGRNDQKGFIQMLKGAFQGIRSPAAHTLNHNLTGEAAARYMIFASLLAKRLDEADVVKEPESAETRSAKKGAGDGK
ncbi:MAG TPA: TIGR02391 family protein [Terriglobales bacterium]|nr:TIGR02391 family protein [Terriglobales bacterium]